MEDKVKKSSLLVMTIVLVMGTLGVGFAAWEQGLTIKGTVWTGYIAAEFMGLDVEDDPYVDIIDISYTNSDSAVKNPEFNTPLMDELNVTFKYAYPGYRAAVSFQVKNTGTVPFYLDQLFADDIKVDDGNALVTDIITIDGMPDWSNLVIEPGQNRWYTFDLFIPGEYSEGFVDPAQWHIYKVTVPLMAVQSNAGTPTP
jgi:hypothetical protein